MTNKYRAVWDPNHTYVEPEVARLSGEACTRAFMDIHKSLEPVRQKYYKDRIATATALRRLSGARISR